MQRTHADNPKALTKKKEVVLYQALQQAAVQFEYQVYIPFKGCGIASETAYAYPDFTITMPWGNLIIECDETQHTHYPSSCDVRRDFDIVASLALGSGQKLAILRYNPDAFRVAGKTRTTSQKDRLAKLVQTVTTMEEPPVSGMCSDGWCAQLRWLFHLHPL